jgi:chemotaxis family two-component system sensor kinase Cph1
VSADGIGIEPENVQLVFTMFTQMEAHSTRSKGGIGIGPTLAERLASLHGGSISARSQGPGRGAEFEVILPESALGAVAAAPSPAESSAGSRPVRRGKVLVVDDVEDITATYEMLLDALGYETRTAASAKEAIATFE